MEILDNFLLDIPALRFQHRAEKLMPHGMVGAPHRDSAQGCNPRACHSHCDLPNLSRESILAKWLPKNRDGHHKKALFRGWHMEYGRNLGVTLARRARPAELPIRALKVTIPHSCPAGAERAPGRQPRTRGS